MQFTIFMIFFCSATCCGLPFRPNVRDIGQELLQVSLQCRRGSLHVFNASESPSWCQWHQQSWHLAIKSAFVSPWIESLVATHRRGVRGPHATLSTTYKYHRHQRVSTTHIPDTSFSSFFLSSLCFLMNSSFLGVFVVGNRFFCLFLLSSFSSSYSSRWQC